MSPLESVRNIWEIAGDISTIVVIVGIIGEFAAEFTNFSNVRHDASRRHRLAKISTVIVIVGLASELLCHNRSSKYSQQINAILIDTAAASNKAAAEATKEAGIANQRAGEANENAAKFQREANSLRKDAEAEHLARVQLQTAIAPRVLTKRQLQQITDDCRPFASSDVHILVRGTMGAGMAVAAQVMNALEAAGFAVSFDYYRGTWYELGISLPQDEHWQIGVSVSSAVAKAGEFPIMGFTQVLPAGSPITLTIGDKSIGKLPPLKPPHSITQRRIRMPVKNN
jgi:hypothetical protein